MSTLDATTPDFTTSEGLRLLLVRFHYGSEGWSYDPEAAELMAYAMGKYAALARKHGYEPVEAAIAAFDAMRNRAVRVAEDPWAVVTRAVELTLMYESAPRACSVPTTRHVERPAPNATTPSGSATGTWTWSTSTRPSAIPAPQD